MKEVRKKKVPQEVGNGKMTMTIYEYPTGCLEIDGGLTKSEFHAILDKASQPIKHEAESDSGKSET
jgi:hypothetical protein